MSTYACLFDDATYGFDVGVFDFGTINEVVAETLTASEAVQTQLQTTETDTLTASESIATKIISYPTDTILATEESDVSISTSVSEECDLTDDIALLWTGFDYGLFDTVTFDAVSTVPSTFTKLITTQTDSAVATEVITTQIIPTILDTLEFTDAETTQIATTETDELELSDYRLDGFDIGVFDTLEFDSMVGNTVWTKLIATILDSFPINLERIYTEGQVQYADHFHLTDSVSSQIGITVQESFGTLEVVATQLNLPVQTDSLTLADLSSTILIHAIAESAVFTEMEAVKIVAMVAEHLHNLEAVSTKIFPPTQRDTLVLTELVSADYILILLSHMTDGADLDSSIIDSITLISKVI